MLPISATYNTYHVGQESDLKPGRVDRAAGAERCHIRGSDKSHPLPGYKSRRYGYLNHQIDRQSRCRRA